MKAAEPQACRVQGPHGSPAGKHDPAPTNIGFYGPVHDPFGVHIPDGILPKDTLAIGEGGFSVTAAPVQVTRPW